MRPEEREAFLSRQRWIRIGVGAVVVAVIVAFIIVGIAGHTTAKSTSSGFCDLGSVVTLQDSSREVFAGDTRSDLDQIEQSLAPIVHEWS